MIVSWQAACTGAALGWSPAPLHEEIIRVLSDLDMYMMFNSHPIILQITFNGHLESAAYFTDLEERSNDVMLI